MAQDFDPAICRNETEVETKLIAQYLLPALGYDPKTWHQEVVLGSIRLDFLAFTAGWRKWPGGEWSPWSVIIEAKSPSQNLNPHERKLKRHLTQLQAPYGVLTNGKDFRIFRRDQQQVHLVFQCGGAEISDRIEEIRSWIGRNPTQNSLPTSNPDLNLDQNRNRNPDPNPNTLGSPQPKAIPPPIAIQVSQNLPTPPSTSIPPPVPTPVNPNLSFPQPTPPTSTPSPILERTQTLSTPAEAKTEMKVIAIYHNKGGVGKTTTTVNLAAALSKKGKRVLVVD
jgi:hypothetical protein